MVTLFDISLSSELNSISNLLYNEIYQITHLNYDIDNLRTIFPEFSNDLETFEVVSYLSEEPLYDVLSTPNVKLYYPEPFIASPSFAHEDL